MSTAPGTRRRLPPAEALHVLTLTTFAVAQPLFDLLGRNASFFVAHRVGRADVVLFSIATVLVPAAVLLLARYVVSFVSRSVAHVFHLVCLSVLGALALTPPVVRAWGIRAVPALAIAIAVGIVIVHLYRRYGGFRRFLSLLGLSVIAFPGLFLFASPVRDLILPKRLPASELAGSRMSVDSDTPVMVVLFDELSISSIITPDGKINGARFPNFRRFAERSTWYREATTSGLRTDQAVPAILTGRRVPRRQVPSSFTYPDNLFTLLSRTHELHVHESVTQLCPPELCPRGTGEPTAGLGPLFADAAVVYGHLVLPRDVAARFLPPLGDRWAGFTRDAAEGAATSADLGGGDPVKAWLRSALLAAREQHEGEVLDDFLEGVRPTGEPQLSWVHLQVPHPPWRYLPTGQVYPTGSTTPGYRDFTWSDDQYLANEVLQRSLLQTKFADELMGRIEHHLKKIGLWDETLLVVTSDHGATWEAGESRRDVGGDQRASLLGIPLLVKYPDQRDGAVEKRNAETVDIVPTIADVIGVDVPWETHGSSLLREQTRTTKRVFDGRRQRVVRYSFRESRIRSAEIESLFGSGGGPDDLYAFGADRGLLGTRPAEPSPLVSPRDVELRITDEAAYGELKRSGPVVPALFRARLDGNIDDGRRAAVALNGEIAGVGRTFREDGRVQLAMMLSPRFLNVDGANRVEVFLVAGRDHFVPLRS